MEPQLKYFSDEIIGNFVKHARENYPNECCGLIIDGKYYPQENIAEDKTKDFKILPRDYLKASQSGIIECIVHSHDSYPHASKKDMVGQIETGIPWGIVSLNRNQAIEQLFFWGDQLPVQTLLGRPFIFGVYDCFALVRDYLRTKDILIPQFPRENFFWKSFDKQGNQLKPLKMLEDNYELAGFIEISRQELQSGDFFFAKLQADIINHCGIYIGNGLIMHHLYNRLSKTEPIYRFEKYIQKYLRYVGEEKNAS